MQRRHPGFQGAAARCDSPAWTLNVCRFPKSRTRTVPLMTFVSVPSHLSLVSHSVPRDAPTLYLPRTRQPPFRSPARFETLGRETGPPTSTWSVGGDGRAARFALPSRDDDPRQSGRLPASRSSVTGRRRLWRTLKRPSETEATWRAPMPFAVTSRTSSALGSIRRFDRDLDVLVQREKAASLREPEPELALAKHARVSTDKGVATARAVNGLAVDDPISTTGDRQILRISTVHVVGVTIISAHDIGRASAHELVEARTSRL